MLVSCRIPPGPITHSQGKKVQIQINKTYKKYIQELSNGANRFCAKGCALGECQGGEIKDQEKASKYLKRSDLRMKTIVSVRMSSFVISLYALLPYKSKSEKMIFG